ncbi:MAG TPA: hypothetical protein VFP59_17995 [Candidatus Angelobacter sp.]|nr:hypothetical protein [Candidatus Angelobacter sp.]
MSWLRRLLQRQYDLARGVDADLLRANRRRFKLAAALLCLGLLFAWIAVKIPLPPILNVAATILIMLLMIASFVLFHWAWAEQRFLRKPDPEPPPSILKD